VRANFGIGALVRQRNCRVFAAAALAAILIQEARAQGALPPGFVYLRDVDPRIAQDMRYAGSDNFVGRPLPGYDAAECILRQDVAAALKRVQTDLAAAGLSLKVYDCYRPARAVRAMAGWAHDGRPGEATRRFFPKLQKGSLFALGYISSRSQHSTGVAVDLTLIAAGGTHATPFDPRAAYGPCTGPATQRSPDDSVDMGTGFDCFDAKSHTASGDIASDQRQSRRRLVAAMAAHGFHNYHREWWHFSYGRLGIAAGGYDFPIRPRTTVNHAGGHADERAGRR
jgi:zinc D-Ala-D-Ala dipeptidase